MFLQPFFRISFCVQTPLPCRTHRRKATPRRLRPQWKIPGPVGETTYQTRQSSRQPTAEGDVWRDWTEGPTPQGVSSSSWHQTAEGDCRRGQDEENTEEKDCGLYFAGVKDLTKGKKMLEVWSNCSLWETTFTNPHSSTTWCFLVTSITAYTHWTVISARCTKRRCTCLQVPSGAWAQTRKTVPQKSGTLSAKVITRAQAHTRRCRT